MDGLRGVIVKPLSLNRYILNEGDATNYIDTTGRNRASLSDFTTTNYINYYITISSSKLNAWQKSINDRELYPSDENLAAAEHFLWTYHQDYGEYTSGFQMMYWATMTAGYSGVKKFKELVYGDSGARSKASLFEVKWGELGIMFGATDSWTVPENFDIKIHSPKFINESLNGVLEDKNLVVSSETKHKG